MNCLSPIKAIVDREVHAAVPGLFCLLGASRKGQVSAIPQALLTRFAAGLRMAPTGSEVASAALVDELQSDKSREPRLKGAAFERTFYTAWMEDRFPDAACPRCQTLGQLYTVPLRLIPPGETAWQALCGDCFRSALRVEPDDDLLMKPIRHGQRARRR